MEGGLTKYAVHNIALARVVSLYKIRLKENDKDGSWGSWIFYGLQGADKKEQKKLSSSCSPNIQINHVC